MNIWLAKDKDSDIIEHISFYAPKLKRYNTLCNKNIGLAIVDKFSISINTCQECREHLSEILLQYEQYMNPEDDTPRFLKD